ncbi:MAG: hypothetical protein NW224_20495 [Leptolyngbyaceae cyanobacterium bins.302]|nr:hypothetical protein [Leptolyngbyaceae cyanobacterium bins.302]
MARKRLSDLLREEVQKPAEATSTEVPVTAPTKEAVEAAETAIAANNHAAELEAAKQRETELNQQITHLNQQLTDLKTELKTQTASTKKLQTSLEKAEQRSQQLESELTEAKQTALQLADSNAELKHQIEAIKQSPMARSTIAKPAAPVAKSPPAAKPNPADKPATKPLSQQEVLRRQADSLAHPIFPIGKTPGQFTDQDLGWFD